MPLPFEAVSRFAEGERHARAQAGSSGGQEPRYRGVTSAEIPTVEVEGASIKIIAGTAMCTTQQDRINAVKG